MKKNLRFPILKTVLPLGLIPLWFAEFFRGVGHLPDAGGSIHKAYFYHSMFENITDLGYPILPWVSILLCAATAVFSIFPKNRLMRNISNVLFWVAGAGFLLCLLLAATVARGY